MERGISVLIFLFLLFVLVAYMVLVKDIWTPLVAMTISDVHGDLVLLFIVLLMTPFLLQRTLHALRFNCYVGFTSVSLLCLALCHHGITSPQSNLKIWPTHISDVLFAFPIITLSFLSHFNILPIQSALVEPSRSRINGTIHAAVGSCFVLMYLFGLCGYLYAGEKTEGNILINIANDTTDWMFFIGRIGCGITIMLAMPMMLLPCRESLLEVLDVLFVQVIKVTERTPLNHRLMMQTLTIGNRNPYVHYGTTLAIVIVTYLGAVVAPGVALVWSLCGSSMAFLISFILPSACYLEIGNGMDSDYRIFSSALLIIAVVGAIACTIQTLFGIVFGYS